MQKARFKGKMFNKCESMARETGEKLEIVWKRLDVIVGLLREMKMYRCLFVFLLHFNNIWLCASIEWYFTELKVDSVWRIIENVCIKHV